MVSQAAGGGLEDFPDGTASDGEDSAGDVEAVQACICAFPAEE